jgi:hypothetical protein
MGREAAWILDRGPHRAGANPSATAGWDAWGDVRRDGAWCAALQELEGAGAGKWVGPGLGGRALDAALQARLDQQVRPV